MQRKEKSIITSWESVEKWYLDALGEEGLYYHKKIIIPGVMRLMDIKPTGGELSVLDLACGHGVLARYLPQSIPYSGVDIAPSFIRDAKQYDKNPLHQYAVADVTKPLPISRSDFTHATVILALQNIEHPDFVFKNVHKHLKSNGMLLLVMNHPCFRIPRQSSWKVDEEHKLQYRRIDRYYSPLKIPVQAHPSQGDRSPSTWSFHYPLSSYTRWLYESGFAIELIEEWCSDKVSTGKAAKMENRSREEFPLFMTIRARKVS